MFIRFAQLLIVVVPIAAFAWLLNQELVPSGSFVVRYAVGESSPFIDRLLPDARVNADGVVTDDPIFFFAHPHRHFDRVDAEVWFQNDSVPILELGALGNVETQAYALRPLQNLIVDNLGWIRLEKDGLVLLQRELTYRGIDEFLENPPAISEIATYQTSLAKPYVLEGYAPTSSSRMLDVSLRGSHEFKTYAKDETLSFDFAYMDMNRDDGADAMTVVITDATGITVADARAPDDGNVSNNAKPTALRHVTVSAAGLPEGVYKVAMQGSRDIFWRTITTTQQKMVFLNNLFLADEVGYKPDPRPVTFWTEAKHLSFSTRHVEGLQDITDTLSSGPRLTIDEPYRRFDYDVNEFGVVSISTEKGDLEVTADGHVAFSQDAYFNPDPARLTHNTDLDRLGVNYVLAEYVSPERVGDWYVARATFDTDRLVLDDSSWKFVISAPGIKDLGASLTVGRVDMIWTREPFQWNDLYAYLARTH
ncbi:hypothetical protein A2348_00475 [Candidatus Uhrbacteria bacterium RIFOXYB12_FULL_58_10]|uniref:Uncharacterized protein n=1 Tax=Candidatus Uhrbacteria bacterium RIFOXYB2_FULL_57_15 TaxID=1802422 RepID=A0A1F7W8G4_9BACT|nr:MAG: hypothetical protein A2348_00475 [Candidatus Uhrbacteria bacterium RIFOXYB12_FULL_58_10]OGL98384.1 MAG: hypothetical protein A2304_01665 [Candidatus Uhrbacteria bacterium RIFOXYB2_FULL_57_15]